MIQKETRTREVQEEIFYCDSCDIEMEYKHHWMDKMVLILAEQEDKYDMCRDCQAKVLTFLKIQRE